MCTFSILWVTDQQKGTHMATQMTATGAKNAKPKNKEYTLSAGESLYLVIKPSGVKSWLFRYRVDNKSFKKSLGKYPALTLEKAREKRNAAKVDLANGIDPFPKKVHEKVHTKEEKTFKEWAEWYIETLYTDGLSDTHISRTIKSFKKDVYPIIGDMPINDIMTRDIIKILHVMKERTAIESARKTFSSINRVFSKAISNFPDDINRNPTSDISLSDVIGKKKTVSYPVITDDKELGLLIKSISEYGLGEQEGQQTLRGHSSTRLALMMLAHVFTRPSNVRLAEWEEIDLKAKQWIIPASKMKTKKELIVPLSKQVLKILEEAKEVSPLSKLVFPSNRSITSPFSDAAMVGALRRIGYDRSEIVAHSFRGIFSTIAHEDKTYSHDVIETQLAHTVGSQVSQAYNRAKHLPERVEMMQWYSDHLEHIMSDEVQNG